MNIIKYACLLLGLGAMIGAGTVKVPDVKDTLILKDGTEVKGTVIVAGERMVCMVVEEKEIEYETEKVQEIKYGKVAEEVTSYKTAEVDGQEKIVAKGADTAAPAAPAPAKAAARPQPKAAPKPKPKPASKPAPRKNVPFNYPKVKAGGDAVKNIQNLLKNPAIANQIRNMNKTGQLEKYLQQNKIPLNASQVMQMLNQMSK